MRSQRAHKFCETKFISNNVHLQSLYCSKLGSLRFKLYTKQSWGVSYDHQIWLEFMLYFFVKMKNALTIIHSFFFWNWSTGYSLPKYMRNCTICWLYKKLTDIPQISYSCTQRLRISNKRKVQVHSLNDSYGNHSIDFEIFKKFLF